jgi:hypothetical protein
MMMKRFLIFGIALIFSIAAMAQPQTLQRHKIALFVPLYLDSAFVANNYRFDKTFPKFLHPGLEFYQGAQAAFDSLNKVGAPLEVFVFDSRSSSKPLAQQINSPQMNGVEMIIGHANAPDVRLLADVALKKKVPFISATLPNDANVSANPYYVIINSTLRTHADGIYAYLQKNHRNDRIIVYTKAGAQEQQLKQYLQEFEKNTAAPKVKLQFQDIGNVFNVSRLTSNLDSNKKSVCIVGSLDESFGMRIAEGLASVSENYPITLIGMPTWDGLNFTKPEFRHIDIVYSTPFNYGQWSALGTKLAKEYEEKINSRPSDMFFRGYETVLRSALLLLDTKKDVASNLTRKGNYIFTQFDIQPVFLDKQNMVLDYFENKKLYYVHIANGLKTVR